MIKNQEKMKKIISFIMVCLYALGVIGGIGSAIYADAWPCAIGVVALAVMAWPQLKAYFNYLKE